MTKTQIKQAHRWAESYLKRIQQRKTANLNPKPWGCPTAAKSPTTIKQVLARFVHQFHLIGVKKYTKTDYISQIEMLYWNGQKAIKNMTLKELYKEIDVIYKIFNTGDGIGPNSLMTFTELVEATMGD